MMTGHMHLLRFLRQFLVPGAWLLGVSLSGQTIVFDTLSVTPGYGSAGSFANPYVRAHSQRFTVAGSGADVEITQVLFRVAGGNGWAGTLELWSDNGATPLTLADTPGSLLQTFDSVTGVNGTVDVAFTGSVYVTPGTSYWFRLRADAGEAGDAAIAYFGDGIGGSSGGAGTWLTADDYHAVFDAFGSYTFPNNGTSVYAMQITAIVPAAVPEPATCAALFGAGALAFAAWRRRTALA